MDTEKPPLLVHIHSHTSSVIKQLKQYFLMEFIYIWLGFSITELNSVSLPQFDLGVGVGLLP